MLDIIWSHYEDKHSCDSGADTGFEGAVLLVFAVERHVAFAFLADNAVDDHAVALLRQFLAHP